MSDHSAIQWTDATWNPTTGCTKISPGCAHCYIERTPAFRIAGRKFVNGHIPLQLHGNRLEQPLHWRKPRRVFVNSLSDLFHDDVPDTFILAVFSVMEQCPQHTFQILTKRPERMRTVVGWLGRKWADEPTPYTWPLPNVWLGVSVENQHWADARIPLLLRTPAAVRFISAEPLLGPINLRGLAHPGWVCPACYEHQSVEHEACRKCGTSNPFNDTIHGLDWVIVGVEKVAGNKVGRNADAYKQQACSLLQQCIAAGVAPFHKQMPIRGLVSGNPAEWPEDLRVREFPR